MQNLYTEALVNFLERNENTPEWLAIKEKFNKFPIFNLQALNFNMYDLFVDKYKYREIGCEDEEVWYTFVNNKLNELSIKYIPKIDLFLNNFSKSVDRTIQLNEQGTNENKINPITSTNSKTQALVTYTGSKEQAMLFFKSNPELLESAMNIKDIYLDCLNEFSTLFMEIY